MSLPAGNGTALVYIAETAQDKIVVYSQASRLEVPVATITSGLKAPYGTWVDQQQNLWVANAGAAGHAGYLPVFAPNASKPSRRIEVPVAYGPPQQVWVDSDGTIYTVECQGPGCNITRRDTGGTWQKINDPNLGEVTGIVGDGAGDLYAEGFDKSAHGATVQVLYNGSWLSIAFPYFTKPAQIAWDQNGEIVIESASVGNVFYYVPAAGQFSGAFLCPACYALAPSVKDRELSWWVLADGKVQEVDHAGVLRKQLVLPSGVSASSIAVSPALFP